MKFVEGDASEYNESQEDRSNLIYLILYEKDNCPACKDAIPKIEHYLTEFGYTDDKVKTFKIHVNTLSMDQIRERQLRSAPTLHVFQNGEFLGGIRGGLGTTPYSYLDSELGTILESRLSHQ